MKVNYSVDCTKMVSDSLTERSHHRAHLEAIANEMGCFYRARSAKLCAVPGLFDLYYFKSEQAASMFARRERSQVLETTQATIWRVSIPVA